MGDGRREGRLAVGLRLALAAQVEVEARGAVSTRCGPRPWGSRPGRRGPGGRASAFWLPTTTTSTPQASVSSLIAPAPEMASTTSRVPGRSRVTRARPSMSCAAPVDDSESWTNTARMASSRSRAAATASGGTASPQGASSTSTFIPCALPISAQRWPKLPGDERQHRVARRERVHDRRLHRPGARAGQDQHVAGRLQEVLEPRATLLEDRAELVGAVMEESAAPAPPCTRGWSGVGPGVNSLSFFSMVSLEVRRQGVHRICGKPCGNVWNDGL